MTYDNLFDIDFSSSKGFCFLYFYFFLIWDYRMKVLQKRLVRTKFSMYIYIYILIQFYYVLCKIMIV